MCAACVCVCKRENKRFFYQMYSHTIKKIFTLVNAESHLVEYDSSNFGTDDKPGCLKHHGTSENLTIL